MSKRIILAAVAAAVVTLSSGVVLAQQVVVCQPVCALQSAGEASSGHGNQGRTTASANQTQPGSANSSGGSNGGAGGTPIIVK